MYLHGGGGDTVTPTKTFSFLHDLTWPPFSQRGARLDKWCSPRADSELANAGKLTKMQQSMEKESPNQFHNMKRWEEAGAIRVKSNELGEKCGTGLSPPPQSDWVSLLKMTRALETQMSNSANRYPVFLPNSTDFLLEWESIYEKKSICQYVPVFLHQQGTQLILKSQKEHRLPLRMNAPGKLSIWRSDVLRRSRELLSLPGCGEVEKASLRWCYEVPPLTV